MNGRGNARRQVQTGEREQAAILGQQAHHDRLAELGRHGRDAYVDHAGAELDGEATVLGQALFRNVETGHELEPQRHRVGDLRVGLGLDVQHAVDAVADAQALLLRLDVDVGSAHPQGFGEQRIEQAHDRCVFGARAVEAEQVAEVLVDARELGPELPGEADDVFGVSVGAVNRAE